MNMDFQNSETKLNLMRAFAGESQARNRYTMAAEAAKKQGLPIIASLFTFTADQERAHAEIFYNHLKPFAGETIHIDGGYPVDISDSIVDLLRAARHNEYEEYEDVYRAFGEKAKEEGFTAPANSFLKIAEIEKAHGDRFEKFADLLEQNKLYASDAPRKWMCLNCGHIYEGTSAPAVCPVCGYAHPWETENFVCLN